MGIDTYTQNYSTRKNSITRRDVHDGNYICSGADELRAKGSHLIISFLYALDCDVFVRAYG